MAWIVIEAHGGPEYATVVTDEHGNNKIFDYQSEAEEEAADCQEGFILEV